MASLCTTRILRLLAGAAGLLLAPALASAATLRVPAQFATIQAAVDAADPGDTIRVAAGVYREQVTIGTDVKIVGAGAHRTIVRAPEVLARDDDDESALVTILETVAATLTRLSISGPGSGTCESGALTHGVLVLPEGKLDLRFASIERIQDTPLASCFRSGNGIVAIGATATVRFSTVSNYQSAGIVILGGSAQIDHNLVHGPGATPATVAEGILFAEGATGEISDNIVTGNGCGGVGCGTDFFSDILAFGIGTSDPGTVVARNLVLHNQVGIYDFGFSDLRSNLLVGNDFGMALQDGTHRARGDVILGGDVGVAVIAAEVDTTAVLERVRILGTSGAPVEELECCGLAATAVRR